MVTLYELCKNANFHFFTVPASISLMYDKSHHASISSILLLRGNYTNAFSLILTGLGMHTHDRVPPFHVLRLAPKKSLESRSMVCMRERSSLIRLTAIRRSFSITRAFQSNFKFSQYFHIAATSFA